MNRTIIGFFERLDQQESPRLEKTQGIIRFELHDGAEADHWLLSVDRGRLHVSKRRRWRVDTEIITDTALFERAIRGEERMIPAILRGDLRIHGNWRLAAMVERLFPGPPDARGCNRRERGSS